MKSRIEKKVRGIITHAPYTQDEKIKMITDMVAEVAQLSVKPEKLEKIFS